MISIGQSVDKANEVQKQAAKLIAEIGIQKKLSQFGQAEFVGSFEYNLMKNRDIDIEVYTEKIDIKKIYEFAVQQAKDPKVIITTIRNYLEYSPSPTMPKCVYYGLQYYFNGSLWNFDVWFLNKKDKLSISGLSQNWYKKMTQEQREKILFLKNNLENKKSVDLYRAVLIEGRTSLNDFK